MENDQNGETQIQRAKQEQDGFAPQMHGQRPLPPARASAFEETEEPPFVPPKFVQMGGAKNTQTQPMELSGIPVVPLIRPLNDKRGDERAAFSLASDEISHEAQPAADKIAAPKEFGQSSPTAESRKAPGFSWTSEDRRTPLATSSRAKTSSAEQMYGQPAKASLWSKFPRLETLENWIKKRFEKAPIQPYNSLFDAQAGMEEVKKAKNLLQTLKECREEFTALSEQTKGGRPREYTLDEARQALLEPYDLMIQEKQIGKGRFEEAYRSKGIFRVFTAGAEKRGMKKIDRDIKDILKSRDATSRQIKSPSGKRELGLRLAEMNSPVNQYDKDRSRMLELKIAISETTTALQISAARSRGALQWQKTAGLNEENSKSTWVDALQIANASRIPPPLPTFRSSTGNVETNEDRVAQQTALPPGITRLNNAAPSHEPATTNTYLPKSTYPKKPNLSMAVNNVKNQR